jgi:hypothetical protein
MTRPYIKTLAYQRGAVEAWYTAKLHLGTQKEIAFRVGLSTARVQQIVADYRRRHGIKVP